MRTAMLVLVLVVAFSVVAVGGEAEQELIEAFLDPATLVTGIYDAVSSAAGGTPDWDFVRLHFSSEALIVLRTSKEESRLLDLDSFIQDFVDFYARIDPAKNGFEETVVSVRVLEYGNIAHCYVVYEAAITGSERAPQRGLDSWHLMQRDGRWWVVSVVNDSEPAAGPVPEEVFKSGD